MTMAYNFDLRAIWQQICKGFLILTWIFGLALGMIAAADSDSISFLMMRGDGFTVSIPGLVLISLLPFLFTAAAVFLSSRVLLLASVFSKAVSFGFCAYAITELYGSASWLIRPMLMFSDICSLPFLMWLWLRCAQLPSRFPGKEIGFCLSVSLILGIVDYWMISPIAAYLI